MTDLTKITTPFGLLDKETQAALKAHGGPYEAFQGSGLWAKINDPLWAQVTAYRVKPAPLKPREWWINPEGLGFVEILDGADVGHFPAPWVRVREVLP